MVIRPGEVHENPERARLGVGLAAETLGVKCSLTLQTMWLVQLAESDRKAFIDLARECAEQ
jgi:hypothetical protein